MPFLWGVARNRTHTRSVRKLQEREEKPAPRKNIHSIEYEQRIRVEDQELITSTNKEKNTNGQEC
jgi:hypothetical protein